MQQPRAFRVLYQKYNSSARKAVVEEGLLEMIMLCIWMQALFSGPLAVMRGEPTAPVPKQGGDRTDF
jgi:hypothetical protein